MNQLPVELTQLQTQQSYTDLNQLNTIRQAGKKDQAAALQQVAQQFEAMFLQMMLKSMRAANDVFGEDNPLNSFESQFHRDLFDQQLTLTLSQGGGTGLAEAFYRQMASNYLPEQELDGELTDPQRRNTADPYAHQQAQPIQHLQDSRLLDTIDGPEDFIAAVTPYAKSVAATMGVDYRVLVAQSALETGWGEHSIRDRYGKHALNLFNIKADSHWQGHHVTVPTVEFVDGVAQKQTAQFRRYQSIDAAFADYQQFLTQPRYQQALRVAGDSTAFLNELQLRCRQGYRAKYWNFGTGFKDP